jgi:collagen type III alpha
VQRMLAPFRKLGGQSRGSPRVDTPGGDSMGRNLISPAPMAAAATAGGAAAASAARNRSGRGGQSQPPMRQTGRLHPGAAPATAVGRDSNRVSTFTYDSVATSGFTPSPVSPISPASMLSPGTVRTSRPIQAPPDPRIIASANAHVTRGSMSSTSTASGISAALSPGQMAWPMPPGTPPAIQHPDGPQYLNFQQSGETVVRINQPPRSNRRSGGY